MIHLAVCSIVVSLPALNAPATRPAAADRQAATRPALIAAVDPRVELMSVIFRLAGNPEYNMRASQSPYSEAVEDHFGKFRDHPAVTKARQLRGSRGVSFDAVMGMAVHIEDAVSLKERVPFDNPACKLDSRWRPDEARDFLKAARAFAKETGFAGFMRKHQDLHAAAAARMIELLKQRDYVGWFDSFFGARPNATFGVIVGMLEGGGNYGVTLQPLDGREEITPIIGVWKFDDEGVPVFTDEIIPTLIHEFCHAYTNQLVDKYAGKMEASASKIYATKEQTMRDQAYGNWQTMLCESMVRACVVRYVNAADGKAQAQEEINEQHGRGFERVGELAMLLQQYERARDRYPDMDAFMPRVVTFFDDYAKKAGRLAGRKPKVVTMVPANGAKNVDPSLAEMKVTFNRPMKDGNWAVIGGGPSFPEMTGKPSYDATRTVLTIPMRPKPNWEYRLWLNRGQFNSFMSEEGERLESVAVTFRTRAE
jgi:hypothetical protein